MTYQDPVRVHDCVQSVGDGEDSALGELIPYCLLDNSISPTGKEPVHQVTNGSLQPVLISQRTKKSSILDWFKPCNDFSCCNMKQHLEDS